MTYNPQIPQSTESPRSSVGEIRGNFGQYDTVFQINHVGFNSNAHGKHSKVVQKRQTVDPDVPGGWSTIYCKDAFSAAFGTHPEIFFRIPKFLPDDVDNTPTQITYPQVVTSPGVGTPYQSFLPGGYILYANTIPAFGGTGAASQQITVTPTPSFLVAVFVQINTNTPQGVTVTIQTPDKFTVFRGAGLAAATYNYIAIGKA